MDPDRHKTISMNLTYKLLYMHEHRGELNEYKERKKECVKDEKWQTT